MDEANNVMMIKTKRMAWVVPASVFLAAVIALANGIAGNLSANQGLDSRTLDRLLSEVVGLRADLREDRRDCYQQLMTLSQRAVAALEALNYRKTGG